jgi:hypothetical protein
MYDAEKKYTIAKLLDDFGKDECLRCGLLAKDDNETLSLTAIGMGYLLDIEASNVKTLHEAYAAGFRQGYEQAEDSS